MRRFGAYLLTRPLGFTAVIVLVVLYLMMAFAEFIAPHPHTRMFPEFTFHPPNARIINGRLVAQEWVVTNTITWSYARIAGQFHDVRFFGEAEPYRLWATVPATRRLLTTGVFDRETRAGYPLFLFGADHMGRCVFSRVVMGSRVSLSIGLIVTSITLLLGVFFGGLAGYFGGMMDAFVMRLSEFFMLVPNLFLILFLRSLFVGVMDPTQMFLLIVLILGLVGWPGMARMIRGMVHAIKREEFVLNAKLEMIPSPIIIGGFIVPQISSLLIVTVALSIPGAIMLETALSFLGLGISDPGVSWGSLIRRDALSLTNMVNFPWLLSPIWFILAVTLGFNFLGDSLRDYFDPYHAVFRKKGAGLRATFSRLFKKQEAMAEVEDKAEQMAERVATFEAEQNGGRTPFLSVRNLHIKFTVRRGKTFADVPAVRGVSFNLEKGECLGIVGESGSGKTVSTVAIPGLLPKNAHVSGSIRFEGSELHGLGIQELRKYRGKKIGMIFQEPGRSFDPLQNIGSSFVETFRNSYPNISKEEAHDRAVSLLAETGIDNGRERLANYPHQFSGGQLQRIGIALALAQGCDFLIADEPTTALDVTIQKQIIDLLKSLRQTRNLSIIFISHDIDLVADISDRITVMYGGLVMETGTPKEITENPQHPYTRALLASSPKFGSHYSAERLTSIPGSPGDNWVAGCPFAPRCAQAKPECSTEEPKLVTKDGRQLRCLQMQANGK